MIDLIAGGLGLIPVGLVVYMFIGVVSANGKRPASSRPMRPMRRIPWSTTLLMLVAGSLLSGVGVSMWHEQARFDQSIQQILVFATISLAVSAPLWLLAMLLARRIERLRGEGIL